MDGNVNGWLTNNVNLWLEVHDQISAVEVLKIKLGHSS